MSRAQLNLKAFIVNVPTGAIRFQIVTRSALGAETLFDVDAAVLLDKTEPGEVAAHCVTSAASWAEEGPSDDGGLFTAQYVDADGRPVASMRFRAGAEDAALTEDRGGSPPRDRVRFDGSGESILAQQQSHIHVLMEHNLRSQSQLADGYNGLLEAMQVRLKDVEGRNTKLETRNEALEIVVREQADAASSDDNDLEDERFEKLVGAGMEMVKQLNQNNNGSKTKPVVKTRPKKAAGNGTAATA